MSKVLLEEGREEGLEQGRTEGLEEGREEGLEQGRTEGLEQGREERALEIARIMKAEGDPIEKVVRVTGLTEDAIAAL